MAKLTVTSEAISFNCPGCGTVHDLPFVCGWSVNDAQDTILPADIYHYASPGDTMTLCHCTVTAGKITFASDSTHALAGRTVDLPDV